MPGSLVFVALLFTAGEAPGNAAVGVCSTLFCQLLAAGGAGGMGLRVCSRAGCRLPGGTPGACVPCGLGGAESAAARSCSIVCARLLVSGAGVGNALVGIRSSACLWLPADGFCPSLSWPENLAPDGGVAGGFTTTLRRIDSDSRGVEPGC